MTYIVLFEDNPDADPNIRQTHMAAHLSFLEETGVVAAGPLTDPEGKGRDGLWIVEASDISDVDRLIQQDPFWPTGLRAAYSIIPWRRVWPKD